MPSKDPSVRATVSRIAAASRWGNSSPEINEARRDLAAERLANYVEQIVAAAPPLTGEQRDRIAALLRGSGDAA